MTRRAWQYTALGVILLLVVGMFGLDEPVFAQLQTGVGSDQLAAGGAATGLTQADPRVQIGIILRVFLGLLGTVCAGLMILGGYYFFTARGREEFIQKGRMTTLRAGIGLVIIIISYSITVLVIGAIESAGDAQTVDRPLEQAPSIWEQFIE